MGNKQTIVPVEDNNFLRTNTKFTAGQIRHLYKRFLLFARPDEMLVHKRDLLMLSDLRDNPLQKEILKVMFGRKRTINFVEFAMFLSIFKGSEVHASEAQVALEDKKLKLLFDMYNIQGGGTISREELKSIIFKMLSDEVEYRNIVRIVDIMLMEIDKSNTGQILYKDFCDSIRQLDVDVKLRLKFPESV